jgi:SAM-dependent methyltransferase
MIKNFGIKRGYCARPAPDYYSDTSRPGAGEIVWQPEVYEVAARAARGLGCGHILDIGCGSGEKLAALHPAFRIIGVDFGGNLAHCREKYPFGTWIEADFEKAGDLPLNADLLSDCMIICSDVIEHLIDPRPLLLLLRSLLRHAPLALISKPERNLKETGWLDNGPPRNPHHVREWTLPELTRFAESMGLGLAYSGLTITNNLRWHRSTILLGAVGDARRSDGLGSNWFPPSVNPAWYWLRVARKAVGEWRASWRVRPATKVQV